MLYSLVLKNAKPMYAGEKERLWTQFPVAHFPPLCNTPITGHFAIHALDNLWHCSPSSTFFFYLFFPGVSPFIFLSQLHRRFFALLSFVLSSPGQCSNIGEKSDGKNKGGRREMFVQIKCLFFNGIGTILVKVWAIIVSDLLWHSRNTRKDSFSLKAVRWTVLRYVLSNHIKYVSRVKN